LIPVLMEIKPIFFFLFGLLWVDVWGKPRRDDFIRYGKILGSILLAEFVLESLLAGRVVRIRGSGEVNYDAMLLLVAMSFLWRNKNQMRKDIVSWFILFGGLFATLSRTALLTGVVIVGLFANEHVLKKMIGGVIGVVGIFLSFASRDLHFALSAADRYWMWIAAWQMYMKYPFNFLFGFGVQPLPVNIPQRLFTLWVDLQQRRWGLRGIYAYNFHSFWIRFTTTWGVVATLVLLIILICFFRRYPAPSFRSLIVVFILEGLTMGTLYLSNVGIPFIIAANVALFEDGYK